MAAAGEAEGTRALDHRDGRDERVERVERVERDHLDPIDEERPVRGIGLRVTSIVLVAAAGVLAFTLGGDPTFGGDAIDERTLNVAGADLALDEVATFDFGTPIPVIVADRFIDVGVTQVSIEMTVGGLSIPIGDPAPLERTDGGSVGAVDLSQAEFLIGGPVDATVVLQDADGLAIVSREFGAEPDGNGLFSIGSVVAVAFSLIAIATSASLVRPMRRRGRRRLGGLVGLGIMGVLVGVALTLFGWTIAGIWLDAASMGLVCAVAVAGFVCSGLASARAGRRRGVDDHRAALAGAPGTQGDLIDRPHIGGG